MKELPQIKEVKVGLVHLFLQHTSCALSLNENWDDDVRADMNDALDGIVVEDKGAFDWSWRGVEKGGGDGRHRWNADSGDGGEGGRERLLENEC